MYYFTGVLGLSGTDTAFLAVVTCHTKEVKCLYLKLRPELSSQSSGFEVHIYIFYDFSFFTAIGNRYDMVCSLAKIY